MSEMTPDQFESNRLKGLEDKGYYLEQVRLYQQAGAQRARQEYADKHPAQQTPEPPLPNPNPVSGGGRFSRTANFVNRNTGAFRNFGNVPRGMPRWLGSRQLILMFWLVSMVLVCNDEWSTFPGKLPRPSRLWYTSAVYGILFLVSQLDDAVPLCNALAGGFTVTLLYENLSGGTFTLFGWNLSGKATASSSGTSTPTTASTSTNGTLTTPGQLTSATGTQPIAPGVVAASQVSG